MKNKTKNVFSTNLQKFGQICFNIFFILLFRLNLQPSFSPQAFFCFVRTGYSSHVISDISSSLDLSKTLFTTGHIYSHLELLSKRFSSRPCYKFREGNDDRNGIYSTPIQVISDAILTFCLSFARRPRKKKMRARVTRDDTIRAKNSTFGYLDATNSIPGKSPVTVSYPDYGSWY